MKKEDRKTVSKTAIITSGAVLIAFAIGGTEILSIFGIKIFSFMIAGGVLLFIVAIELLTHGVWRFGGGTLPGESGVVPRAFPLLAGPGAITSVIISFGATGLIVTILCIAIAYCEVPHIYHARYKVQNDTDKPKNNSTCMHVCGKLLCYTKRTQDICRHFINRVSKQHVLRPLLYQL